MLANSLCSNVPDSDSNSYEAESRLFESIVNSIMDVCQRANPRFNRARFATACGLDELLNSRRLAKAA